ADPTISQWHSTHSKLTRWPREHPPALAHLRQPFDVPLANPDLILFTDGSSFYSEGQRFASYAVTSQWDVIEAASLPGNWGAQAAELYALARACQLATEPFPTANCTASTVAKVLL
ncbi:hypothetical protein G0U57_005041, partial [Chelydra serpentina]